MEASEATPSGAVIAPDLSSVFEGEGPFLTVYLSTEGDVENASQRSQQRWANLRRDLGDQEAPEEALAAVDALVSDAHTQGRCLAAISTAGGLSHVEHGPHAPPFDIGRWAPLPSVLRIIEWRQSTLPYVAVLADRTGADLIGVRPGGPDLIGRPAVTSPRSGKWDRVGGRSGATSSGPRTPGKRTRRTWPGSSSD